MGNGIRIIPNEFLIIDFWGKQCDKTIGQYPFHYSLSSLNNG